MKKNWYSMVSQMQVHRDDPMPVQYILGGTFFFGEWFVITPDVLIPRFETETLVKYILSPHQNLWCGGGLRIIDLGTGSGNIAVILAKKMNCRVYPHTKMKNFGVEIYAVDISGKALEVARENAKMHGVKDKIEFCGSDWYDSLDISPVDLIVSNPPYIAEEEWDLLPLEVKEYEPRIALLGGEKGLEHYKKIISGAGKMLMPGGRIVLEIGYNQVEDVKKMLNNFRDIEIICDEFGVKRVISAVYG